MEGSLVTTDSQKSAEKCCFNSNSLTKPELSKFHVTEKTFTQVRGNSFVVSLIRNQILNKQKKTEFESEHRERSYSRFCPTTQI